MSTGFLAQHEKAHITKDLHICQRFGAEEKGGGALLHFTKFKLEVGFFWQIFTKLSRADES